MMPFSFLAQHLNISNSTFKLARNISFSQVNLSGKKTSTMYFQEEITLKKAARGCHLITDEINKLSDMKKIRVGLCHIHSEY